MATFTFGANGTASHNDGSEATSYTETDGSYTLTLSNLSKVYQKARDAKGNSCLKLGTNSAVGSFKFTVPSDVTQVIIYIGKYKANTTKVTINGTTSTLTKNSNDGNYDAITVDTSNTKTVSVTTVSGSARAMVNTIEFYGAACSHSYGYTAENGKHQEVCSKCGEKNGNAVDCTYTSYTYANNEDGTHAKTSTCTVCNIKYTTDETCDLTAGYVRNGNTHTQVGTCELCGASTTVTENCTLVVDSYQVLNTDNQAAQQHAVTTTCSVCEQTATANEACSFDEGVVNGASVTYTCEHCEYSYTEDTTLYTVTYSVPNGLTAPEAESVAEGFDAVLSSAPTITDYTFLGWVTEALDETTNEAPEYLEAGSEYTVTKDVTLYALYTYVDGNGGAWTKVTDANKLAIGEQIVIAASASDVALATTQNNNNRAQASINKSGDTITFGNDVQIITLEAGTVDGTFAFNVGNSYLYAASSSSNHLKTQTALNANASWKITFDGEIATIKAQGNYTHNWLMYNSSNSLFSCYENGQKDVSIYMQDGAVYYMTNVEVPPSFSGASVTIGEEITLNYYVNIAEGLAEKTTVIFKYNDEIIEAEGELQAEGRYKYSFELAPQLMTVNIKAEIIFNGVVVAEKDYSVATYAYNKLNDEASSEKLKRLVSDLLYYGAAAQSYKGYNLENLASNVEGILPATDATPDTTDFTLVKNEEAASYPVYFKGASVYFDNVNKIYVTLNDTVDENVTLTVNGKEVALEGATFKTDGIKATAFAETYTFVLSYNGEVMQTLTYSVNAYAYAMKDNANMAKLALALYRYGMSATAYNA